jgi:subtilisin family serine protease
MILKSCCSAGGKMFESNTWEAIQYAIKNGAKVISMSLSAKPPSHPQYAKWRQAGEVELAAGIIHVNSAGNLGSGNEPNNMGAPCRNPPAWYHSAQTHGTGGTSMITIGASDQSDKMRDYSSTGPVTWEDIEEYKDFPYTGGKPGLIKPEVCGPSEVPSTSMEGTGYTTEFGGTSSATPHIAGVVALLVSAKPNLSPAQATEALMSTAIEVESPFNNHCGAGRVNGPAALEYVRTHFGAGDAQRVATAR